MAGRIRGPAIGCQLDMDLIVELSSELHQGDVAEEGVQVGQIALNGECDAASDHGPGGIVGGECFAFHEQGRTRTRQRCRPAVD